MSSTVEKVGRADHVSISPPIYFEVFARLLRRGLLGANRAQKFCRGFRQCVDGIVKFVAAIQRFLRVISSIPVR